MVPTDENQCVNLDIINDGIFTWLPWSLFHFISLISRYCDNVYVFQLRIWCFPQTFNTVVLLVFYNVRISLSFGGVPECCVSSFWLKKGNVLFNLITMIDHHFPFRSSMRMSERRILWWVFTKFHTSKRQWWTINLRTYHE